MNKDQTSKTKDQRPKTKAPGLKPHINMLAKTEPDEIQSYLTDASNMKGGSATRVVFPETTEEVALILAEAAQESTPVTVAGAGTGVVGGRVPFGGIVIATDRLNKIKEIAREEKGGRAVVEAGVVLADLQKAVGENALIYPPDPTEWSCFIGGTVATNASGSRTFKYGPTRNFVRLLKIVLTGGEVIDVRRGENHIEPNGSLRLELPSGQVIEAKLPSYEMPRTRKHVAGYFVEPGMDVIDLFIGSEGTLGVITEIELQLLDKPEGVLSGLVFFKSESDLLAFVSDARTLSLENRLKGNGSVIDARALEYFDVESLKFLSQKYPSIPKEASGALYFEQETVTDSEAGLSSKWLELFESHRALTDDSWFATNEQDRRRIRECRHALPVMVNEWLSHHNQRKVSTDMAVPDKEFGAMLDFYKLRLRQTELTYVIFGHIGDNHVHVNILPRDDREAANARELYGEFIDRAVSVGGTISAEHGVGKLKRDYLQVLYGASHLREMAELKRALDPACILGRGNIFPEASPCKQPPRPRHWKRVIAGCLLGTLVLVSLIVWIRVGRIQRVRDRFERIEQGQSTQQVEDFIGQPARTSDCAGLSASYSPEYKAQCDRAYWYYGGFEIWQVHFDQSGKVVGKSHEVSRSASSSKIAN